jgi:hypothetical protein
MEIKALESTTLSAINQLTQLDLPFAAATLCYVMIERCLKLYLLKNRITLAASEIDTCARVGRERTLRFEDHRNDDERDFVNGFLNEIQLGSLEIVFRIQNRRITVDRNRLIHSGFYLSVEKDMTSGDRQNRNWQHYATAARHLQFCSTNCFKVPIMFDEPSRQLSFIC